MKQPEEKFCFCSSCWRDEYHQPVQFDAFTRLVLIVMTFGLAAYLWPYRCRTCGNVRPAHWFARRV